MVNVRDFIVFTVITTSKWVMHVWSGSMGEYFSMAAATPLSRDAFKKHIPLQTSKKKTPPKYAARINRLA